MGITNFPNGVSSFGAPVVGGPHAWLPDGASVYFVSPANAAAPGSNSSATGGYDSPFRTVQYATGKVTAGASTSQGAMIYVNPGTIAEQVTNADKRGIRLIGSGPGLSRFDLTGVSGTTSISVGGNQTAGPYALGIAARNAVVTGFTFKCVTNTYGLYVGDGTRINSSYNYAMQDSHIYGNLFDGDTFAGLYGILVDGIKNVKFYDNWFYKLGGGGILVSSGVNAPTSSCDAYENKFKGCRGYGVRILAGSIVRQWCTGLGNIFEDDNTTALTNPALYQSASGPNSYCGNYEMCANEFSGQSTDFHGGNYEGLAGNSMTHVSQA